MSSFDAKNDDKELMQFDEYREDFLICRSGVCSCGWKYCEWVGICPHSDESDLEFSVRMALRRREEKKNV